MAALLLVTFPALADLTIFPTRVVFDGRARTAQIDLVNTDDKAATYRIRFVQRRMTESGAFAGVDAPLPGEQFADAMIRFSPRQVVLAPGAGQTVRLLLRKPANLDDGEYRSHLVFERVPEVPKKVASNDPPADLDIRLTALVGVSIPVIIRHGATRATASISAPRLTADAASGTRMIDFDVVRDGNRSLYGDLIAYYTLPGGKPQIVAQAKGVAVYSPYPVRRMRMKLDGNAPTPSSQGVLRVEFWARPEDRRVLLGSAESTL